MCRVIKMFVSICLFIPAKTFEKVIDVKSFMQPVLFKFPPKNKSYGARTYELIQKR